ncbi:hypothetical protein J7337_010035 [Fusarium musae]|uniref:Uncharacterized protein n=1 Tax=Fusarium musae TaxID=1042133 RepID=A0A9P8DCF4_9HYPO|nr:hypothetical protein J7337_010035 [Fusarium musae]KAG9499216.1 hypothetical protein J7337_010035 [Fusarium musae]
MKDSLDVLTVGTEVLPPGGTDVVFQLGETLLVDAASSEDDEPGSDIVGNGTMDPLEVLEVGIEVLPPEGREVVFQLGGKLLPVVASAEDERLGNDTVGNGTNDPLEVLIVGTDTLPPDGREVLFQLGPRLLPEVISVEEGFAEVEALSVGNELLPPGGRAVLFQLGPTLLPELGPKLLPELPWLGIDKVGNGTNVPLEMLTVGTEPFPLDVVPFQLGPTLPLDEPPEPAETEAVGNGTKVSLKILTVGTEPLPPETDVVPFHPGPTLLLGERPELADSEAVGNGIVIVGNEPFLPSEVVFQFGAALPLDEPPGFVRSEAVGNGMKLPLERLTVGIERFPVGAKVVFQAGPTLPPVIPEPVVTDTVAPESVGRGPVPEILPLGAVTLELHPVKRVPLCTGLDVEIPGTDHGSELLVVPDLVTPDEWVDACDVTLWVPLPDGEVDAWSSLEKDAEKGPWVSPGDSVVVFHEAAEFDPVRLSLTVPVVGLLLLAYDVLGVSPVVSLTVVSAPDAAV